MSSDGSVSSRVSQFGLYRTIDARTEEFMKLSKKRQIKQGCVCAAISTAITVTVVVIVLLIYEYMIVVETSIVQKRRGLKRNKTIALNDHPIADRLDRTFFGFDQDYYERMPLLVNAMQENTYLDPSTEIFEGSHAKRRFPELRNLKLTTENYRAIRRTSPRPFLYEYRNPIPAPFSKTHSKSYASRSWVESYRNAQRVKNLNGIIKYLEKTVNAKFSDLQTQPSARIAFSGIYLEPFADENTNSPENVFTALGSIKNEYKSNHKFDPLYTFKPDHPGEINLLAEGLKFESAPTLDFVNEILPTVPIFRPILNRKRNCFENECNGDEKSNLKSSSSNLNDNIHLKNVGTLKTFGLMLNLYPIHTTKSTDTVSTSLSASTELDKIYITTLRPKIQFRRKSSFPVRRTSTRSRPRFSSTVKQNKYTIPRDRNIPTYNNIESNTIPKMTVHLNVFSLKDIEKTTNITETLVTNSQPDTSTSATSTYKTIIQDYPILNTSHVEDYHIGSSGVIPIEERTPSPPTLPIVTPNIPVFDTTTAMNEAPRTEPPEVFKFSPEDAKIPDEYMNIRKIDGEQFELKEISRNFNKPIEGKLNQVEANTLIVKLKNYDTLNEESTTETAEYYEEATQTYVPQINGHYRNLLHKSLSTLLRENSEKYKRKLETISSVRRSTYVPTYVNIKRNHTKNIIDEKE